MAWEEVDTRLSMALTLLEAETCSDCGTPTWWGHSTNNEITFKVDSTTCYGCAELEKHRKSKNKLNQNSSHGSKPHTRPRMWDESQLPSRSDEYRRKSERR